MNRLELVYKKKKICKNLPKKASIILYLSIDRVETSNSTSKDENSTHIWFHNENTYHGRNSTNNPPYFGLSIIQTKQFDLKT